MASAKFLLLAVVTMAAAAHLMRPTEAGAVAAPIKAVASVAGNILGTLYSIPNAIIGGLQNYGAPQMGGYGQVSNHRLLVSPLYGWSHTMKN